MKLSHVFGISPSSQQDWPMRHVHTLRDLAGVTDLPELSARSQLSLEWLEQWHAARAKEGGLHPQKAGRPPSF